MTLHGLSVPVTIVETAYGTMAVPQWDIPRGASLIATGKAPDHDEIEMLCRLLRERNASLPFRGPWTESVGPEHWIAEVGRLPIAFDVGANMGTHTLAFAKECQRVFAIEPQIKLADCLRYSVQANGLQNVSVIYGACGGAVGDVMMPVVNYHQMADFGCVASKPVVRDAPYLNGHTLMVQFTIDQLMHDEEGSRVDLIKIDVEGAERDVLLGAAATIGRYRPMLFLEIIHSDERSMRQLLLALGYRDITVVGANWLVMP
jgi:FkbM family methyltransferase